MSSETQTNRTLAEIDAELKAIDTRVVALWAEKARVLGVERAASLPADWREQVVAAAEAALGEGDFGGLVNIDLTPQITLSVNVHVGDE